jgi:hypothetical protein
MLVVGEYSVHATYESSLGFGSASSVELRCPFRDGESLFVDGSFFAGSIIPKSNVRGLNQGMSTYGDELLQFLFD